MRVNQTMIAFLICKREVYAISIMREAFIWNLNLVVTGILFCKQYFEHFITSNSVLDDEKERENHLVIAKMQNSKLNILTSFHGLKRQIGFYMHIQSKWFVTQIIQLNLPVKKL